MNNPGLPFDVAVAKRHQTTSQRRYLRAASLLLPPGSSAFPAPPARLNPRLAVYLRLSQHIDDSVSIRRQFDECLAEVQRLGGSFDRDRDVFHDVDTSASKGLHRPGLEALLSRVRDGDYDGVVVWELPRVLRNPIEALNVRSVFVQGSCELYVVAVPDLSFWGPGSVFFDLHLMMAERETATTSARVKSAARLLSAHGAARGRAVFGTRSELSDRLIEGRSRPLLHFVPDEEPRADLGGRSRADLVRELVDATLSGRPLWQLVGEWNSAGYPTSTGAQWTTTRMTQVLRSPTIGGLAHRGYVLLDAQGDELPPGSKEEPQRAGVGVVDAQTWLRVRDVFASRARGARATGNLSLSGLVSCGRCGGAVFRHGVFYACADLTTGYVTCGRHNSIRTTRLEGFLFDAAAAALDSRSGGDPAPGSAPNGISDAERLEREIAGLDEKLGFLEELWLDTGVRDREARARFDRRRSTLEQAVAARRQELATISSRSGRSCTGHLLSKGHGAGAAFLSADRDVQVAVLTELIDGVLLQPASKGSRFDPSRIVIKWAGSA